METINAPPLTEYGVFTEGSDIRAHVGFQTRVVYVYQTARVRELDIDKYALVGVHQPGVSGPTSRGRLVPPEDIKGMRYLRPHGREAMKLWLAYHDKLKTPEKGWLAVQMVRGLMRVGCFPLWLNLDETSDPDIQIKGTDIIIAASKKVQVKCDARGGNPFLFLQVEECNPLKLF